MDPAKSAVLLKAVELGSISAAAEALGYTPSGASRLIASLEADTGFPLLVRSKSGVAVTAEGAVLLPRLAELAAASRACEEAAAGLRGLACGTLTVGCAYRPLYRTLAGAIAAFTAAYPGLQVRIVHANSTTLACGMGRREIDFALMSRREIDCRWMPLSQDAMVAVVPPDHAAASSGAFPLSRLAEEPFIEIYPGEDSDNARLLSKAGIAPPVAHVVHDTSAAFALVEAGLGMTLMNGIYAQAADADVAMLPLAPACSVEIGIAMPPGRPSPALAAFEDFAIPRLQPV